MALNPAIPTVFSAKVLQALDTALVATQPSVVTTEYEGEIRRQGDRVKISTIADVEIKDYTKNTNIDAAEDLNAAALELIIDQAKYYNFEEDDIDRIQVSIDAMNEAARRAAYGLAKTADEYVLGLYTDVASANTFGNDTTPITITSSNAYQYLVEMKVALDKTDTPTDGRWVILPPDWVGMLLQDNRFVGYGTAPQDQRLANGFVGRAAGFDILQSNNITNISAAKYKVMAGYRGAIGFAAQLNKAKMYEPELRFSAAMKGLYLYGAKVLRPDNLALTVASF